MTDELTASGATLPRADGFVPIGALPAVSGETRPSPEPSGGGAPRGVFASLVGGDGDITGLVAYSIYKQHKLDWLRAFEAAHARPPNDAELASYLCGEGTPRRLATYRHLANATLAGEDPQAVGPPGPDDRLPSSRPIPRMTPGDGGRAGLMERSGVTLGQVAVYALIAVIFVVGVVLALRFAATPPR